MRRSSRKGSPPKRIPPAKGGAKAGAGYEANIVQTGNRCRSHLLPARSSLTWTVDSNLLVVAFASLCGRLA